MNSLSLDEMKILEFERCHKKVIVVGLLTLSAKMCTVLEKNRQRLSFLIEESRVKENNKNILYFQRKIVSDFLFLSRNLRNKIIRMKYAIFPEKDIQFLIPIIL